MRTMVSGLISIVMLVRDQPEYTSSALASLAACDGDLEIIVVDNGSGPGTTEVLSAFRDSAFCPVEVLRFEDDAGGSARRNAGATAARGEYLLFADNDLFADDPRVLRILGDALTADPGLAAVSPLLCYPGSPDLVQCAGGGATADGRIGLVGRGEPLSARHRASREQIWAPAAALLVRRTSFDRAGGFDEAFDPVPLCEDVDLCCRLRAAGEGLRYIGAASMRHYEGTTFNHLGYEKLPIWKRHVRVLRARWADVFGAGPSQDAADIVWRSVEKDYEDPGRPQARLVPGGDQPAAGATFFASDTALLPAGAGPQVPPDVRVAVVGCGQAAVRGALPALAAGQRQPGAPASAPFFDFGPVPGVRVTGLADPDLLSLLAAARWYQVPHAGRAPAALLDTVPAEGVVICAPPSWHAELAMEALRRGQPVLVEKPAALTHEQLDAVLSTAGRAGLDVTVNLPYAYHPALEVLSGLVAAGSAGVPQSFGVTFEHSGPRAWAPRAAWYQELPGGVVTDLGLHALDAAERALGAPVTRVRPAGTVTRDGVQVRARANVTTSGCSGTIEVGWDAPAPRFVITIRFSEATVCARLIPFRAAGPAVEISTSSGIQRVLADPPARAGAGPYAEFVAYLRGGPPARTRLKAVTSGVRAMIGWSQAVCDRSGDAAVTTRALS
jgi:O-antigen biosynthesis protein